MVSSPVAEIATGLYGLKKTESERQHYRLRHPLSEWVLETAKGKTLSEAELVFDYTGTSANISILIPLVGDQGTLKVSKLTISALDSEDYIICSAITDNGQELDDEQARRLFNIPASIEKLSSVLNSDGILTLYSKQQKSILESISQRNAEFFNEEMDKLDHWAKDKKRSLDIQIKDTDAEITQLKNEARKTAGLEEKIVLQRRAKELEKKRTEMRRKLFDSQDEVDRQKESLLDEIEARLQQTIEEQEQFCVRWRLI